MTCILHVNNRSVFKILKIKEIIIIMIYAENKRSIDLEIDICFTLI